MHKMHYQNNRNEDTQPEYWLFFDVVKQLFHDGLVDESRPHFLTAGGHFRNSGKQAAVVK